MFPAGAQGGGSGLSAPGLDAFSCRGEKGGDLFGSWFPQLRDEHVLVSSQVLFTSL